MSAYSFRRLDNVAFDIDLAEVTRRKEYWEDEFDEDKIIFSDDKKRGTNLIWNDFIILTIEYLQWLALVIILNCENCTRFIVMTKAERIA